MEDPKYCLVQFKCSYTTNKDEEVRVVGNTSELGNWDVNHAEKMVYSKIDTSPIWKSKENIKIRQNSTIEYKYVIFKDGKFHHWENLPNCQNRKVNITSMIRVVIWDKQDNPESQIKSDLMPSTDSPKKITISNTTGNILANDFDNNSQGNGENFDYFHFENAQNQVSDYQINENDLQDKFTNLNYQSSDEADDQEKTEATKEKHVDLNDKDEIIMCSFFLPLNCIMNKDKTFRLELTNYPLYHTLFRLTTKNVKYKWIGILKNSHLLPQDEYIRLTAELKEKYNMYAVSIDTQIFEKISILFKEILEPLFHYISLSPSITEEFSHFDIYWEAYKKFNEKMAIDIKSHLNQNTLIYLHDYHFLLVPSYLYSKCSQEQEVFQNLSIGLFMHSPFPSHEIFKRIPFREQILKSMMNCSVIGFHTFDYSRNFLKSAKRLLSINYESTINGDLAVNYYGRTLIIRVKNATPEIDLIKEDSNSEDFKRVYNETKSKYTDKYIYISLDHLKFLSGIKNKLEGYRRFLRDIKSYAKQNVYLEYIRYSSDDLEQDGTFLLDETQREMLRQIEEIVTKIKAEFGEETVELIKKKVSYVERLALFAASNCFIRSSKQESFSLGIYEFLILKQQLNEKTGISYMVSELSGVNTSLAGTIKINPFDYKSINKGFLDAYQTMYDKGTSNITITKDFLHAMKSSTKEWMRSFLRDIKNTKLNDKNTYYLGADEGLNFKLMKLQADFKKLPMTEIIAQYEKSSRRLLFFDYEGTLPSATQNDGDFYSKGQKPSETILGLLEELSADKHNTIFIITGRETRLVSEWFGNVKGLGLAAEHGFMYRFNSGQNKDKWIRMIKDYNNEWINYCVDILDPYTERCEGSFLEVKEASVVWQYRDCDQELGKSFATIITSEFECTSKKMDLKVINGKGYVEIIAKGINKGSFVSSIIKENLAKDHQPDFIMCIGDDTTDEKMFQYLKLKGNDIKECAKNVKINTITVGKKPSKAMYYVIGPNNVQDLIQQFVKVSNKLASSYSTFNIRTLMISKEDTLNTQKSEHDIHVEDERVKHL